MKETAFALRNLNHVAIRPICIQAYRHTDTHTHTRHIHVRTYIYIYMFAHISLDHI